ncbi:hypothetical protein D3C73_1080640 [compost metagenome]
MGHFPTVRHALSKGTAREDLLLRCRFNGQRCARQATQLLYDPLDHHAVLGEQPFGIASHQVSHGVDALCHQLGPQAPPYAPHLIHRGDGHQPGTAQFVTQIHNTTSGWPLLGGIVGQLGEGLGGANPDPYREVGPMPGSANSKASSLYY